MLHEKSRRPPKFYVKLESENPYATTWLADSGKACKLFATQIERELWLNTEEALRLKVSGNKLKKEDLYICKSKIGPIIDIDTNHPIYDVYSMTENLALLDEDMIRGVNSSRASIGRKNKVKEKINALHNLKIECENRTREMIDIVREARIVMDEIERIVNEQCERQEE